MHAYFPCPRARVAASGSLTPGIPSRFPTRRDVRSPSPVGTTQVSPGRQAWVSLTQKAVAPFHAAAPFAAARAVRRVQKMVTVKKLNRTRHFRNVSMLASFFELSAAVRPQFLPRPTSGRGPSPLARVRSARRIKNASKKMGGLASRVHPLARRTLLCLRRRNPGTGLTLSNETQNATWGPTGRLLPARHLAAPSLTRSLFFFCCGRQAAFLPRPTSGRGASPLARARSARRIKMPP